MTEEGRVVSLAAAAKHFGITESAVLRMVERGELRGESKGEGPAKRYSIELPPDDPAPAPSRADEIAALESRIDARFAALSKHADSYILRRVRREVIARSAPCVPSATPNLVTPARQARPKFAWARPLLGMVRWIGRRGGILLRYRLVLQRKEG